MYQSSPNLQQHASRRNTRKGFTPTVKFCIIASAAIRRCASVLFSGISGMKNTFFPQKAAMRNSTAGFTLIEMIVSIGIFMISVLIIVGSLVSLNNASRKARTERISTDNLSAAIDSMSRSMRMGTTFHCGCTAPFDTTLDCPMTDALGAGGDQCIAFEGQGGDRLSSLDQIVFRLSGGHLQRSTDGGATYLDMTAPEIIISNLRFYLQGSTVATDQPVIVMTMRGKSGVQRQTATGFDLQTTIAPRTPNF